MTIADERIPASPGTPATHSSSSAPARQGWPLLQAHARGIPTVVLESVRRPAPRCWSGATCVSSPWSELIDPVAEKLLTENGWTSPDPASYPTGREWVERYLAPLAAHRAAAGGRGELRPPGRRCRPRRPRPTGRHRP